MGGMNCKNIVIVAFFAESIDDNNHALEPNISGDLVPTGVSSAEGPSRDALELARAITGDCLKDMRPSSRDFGAGTNV
jgi:hypothetical protein